MIVVGVVCLLAWTFLMGWITSYVVTNVHSAVNLSWDLRDDYPDVPWVDGTDNLVYPDGE